MARRMKSHLYYGTQFYFERPPTNSKGQRAYKFIQQLRKHRVNKKYIKTTDLENNYNPKVYVRGVRFTRFGPKSVSRALKYIPRRKRRKNMRWVHKIE